MDTDEVSQQKKTWQLKHTPSDECVEELIRFRVTESILAPINMFLFK